MQKKLTSIVFGFLLIVLIHSCRYQPSDCKEISNNRLIDIYKRGDIKDLSYKEKGHWIIISLTDQAFNSGKYTRENLCTMVVSFDNIKSELEQVEKKNIGIKKLTIKKL